MTKMGANSLSERVRMVLTVGQPASPPLQSEFAIAGIPDTHKRCSPTRNQPR